LTGLDPGWTTMTAFAEPPRHSILAPIAGDQDHLKGIS
jgi:hypothetical protein